MSQDLQTPSPKRSEVKSDGKVLSFKRDLAWQVAPTLFSSFRYAWMGLSYAFQTQRNFRHKDQPTDVLSFAALEVDCPQLPDEEPLYLGDIIISVETAARQAVVQGHSLTVELSWLAAHGLLHLLGWDHPDEDSLVEMLTQQEEMLHSIGLAVTWG